MTNGTTDGDGQENRVCCGTTAALSDHFTVSDGGYIP